MTVPRTPLQLLLPLLSLVVLALVCPLSSAVAAQDDGASSSDSSRRPRGHRPALCGLGVCVEYTPSGGVEVCTAVGPRICASNVHEVFRSVHSYFAQQAGSARGANSREGSVTAIQNTHYDLVFNMTSIAQLLADGWPVITNSNVKEQNLDAFKGKIVSVLGMFNRGKTWLLNRLAGTRLSSGYRLSTVGLSFKLPNVTGLPPKQRSTMKSVWLLDTAGSGTPLDTVDTKSHIDRKVMEELISDIAFELTDYYVVVVNDITWQEQLLLSELALKIAQVESDSKAGRQQMKRSLIVVHNMQNTDAAHFAEHYEKRIKPYYPNAEFDDPLSTDAAFILHVHQTVDLGVQQRSVLETHFFLVSESIGDAGTLKENVAFNDRSLSELRQMFKHAINNPPRPINLRTDVFRAITDLLPKYLQLAKNNATKADAAAAGDVQTTGPHMCEAAAPGGQAAAGSGACEGGFDRDPLPPASESQLDIVRLRGNYTILHYPTSIILPRLPLSSKQPPFSVSYKGSDPDRPDEFLVEIELPGLFSLDGVKVEMDKIMTVRINSTDRRPSSSQSIGWQLMESDRTNTQSETVLKLPMPRMQFDHKRTKHTLQAGLMTLHYFKHGLEEHERETAAATSRRGGAPPSTLLSACVHSPPCKSTRHSQLDVHLGCQCALLDRVDALQKAHADHTQLLSSSKDKDSQTTKSLQAEMAKLRQCEQTRDLCEAEKSHLNKELRQERSNGVTISEAEEALQTCKRHADDTSARLSIAEAEVVRLEQGLTRKSEEIARVEAKLAQMKAELKAANSQMTRLNKELTREKDSTCEGGGIFACVKRYKSN